jgi:repressor LexA
MDKLTTRQRQVLSAIYDIVRKTGLPPTVREIGQRVGLRSSCTVQRHLEALERKGYLRRSPTKARAIEIIDAEDPVMIPRPSVPIPLVGAVAAGSPILAVENIEDVFAMPAGLVSEEGCFMLRIQGDSMIEAGLFDGDLVVVRQQKSADDGDIVVALLEDEATVKRFYRQDGKIRLQPANSAMEPIITDRAKIIGKVILGVRRFE